MDLLKNEWDEYRSVAVPEEASPIQVREEKRAFYAGASVLFRLLMRELNMEREEQVGDIGAKFHMAVGADPECRSFGPVSELLTACRRPDPPWSAPPRTT